MEKDKEENSKLDIVIYLLILSIKEKDGLDDRTMKRLVTMLVDSGYKWRDVSDILNISTATISKIINK